MAVSLGCEHWGTASQGSPLDTLFSYPHCVCLCRELLFPRLRAIVDLIRQQEAQFQTLESNLSHLESGRRMSASGTVLANAENVPAHKKPKWLRKWVLQRTRLHYCREALIRSVGKEINRYFSRHCLLTWKVNTCGKAFNYLRYRLQQRTFSNFVPM